MSDWIPGAAEHAYAGWYVWAKRNVSTSNVNSHAAARAATLAAAGGEDPLEAARRSAASRSGPGWENPVDRRTQDYAEMFDWARRNLPGTAEDQHRAAAAGSMALAGGAGLDAAHTSARAALQPPVPEAPIAAAAPTATPPPAASPAASPAPAWGIQTSPDGRYWWDGTVWRPTAGVAGTALFGGFARRTAGLVIDIVLVTIVLGILYVPLDAALFRGATPGSSAGQTGVHFLISILVNWLYASLLIASGAQATLGMMALGIKVVDTAGNRVGFARASGRHFAAWITYLTCGIGYLVMAWSRRRQTLHDMMAGTLVVRRQTPAGTIPSPPGTDRLGVAVALTIGAVLILTALLSLIVLLAMGGQLRNVFSNVTDALNT